MRDEWPKHPSGANKKIGEMTSEEKERILRGSIESLRAEFARQGVTIEVEEGPDGTNAQR